MNPVLNILAWLGVFWGGIITLAFLGLVYGVCGMVLRHGPAGVAPQAQAGEGQGREGADMRSTTGLDGLEKAVRISLDAAESARDFFFTGRNETPWWRRSVRRHKAGMAREYAGAVRAYMVVLGLIAQVRAQDDEALQAGKERP